MYTKVVWSGDEIEVYKYQHEPKPKRVKKEKRVYSSTDTEDKYRKRRSDNVQRARRGFKRIVQSTIFHNSSPFLVTLTIKEVLETRQGYKCLHEFIQKLRYKIGKEFCYIAVPEFQERGAIHFHMLIWNVPVPLFSTERITRYLANIWGHGFVDVKSTDGSKRLIGYLSKYMTKAFLDARLSQQKAYTCSRNICRPQKFKGSIFLDYSKEICGIDLSTVKPVLNKTFNVDWIGECNYNKYII